MKWRPVIARAASAAGAVPVPAAVPVRVTARRQREIVVPRADADPPAPRVELLWFEDCPNHPASRALIGEVLAELAAEVTVEDIDASDPAVAERHRFPGSPTIRVDGQDVDPSFQDPGDYTPRCRLYRTAEGLRGVPERAWVESAIRASLERPKSAVR